VERDERGWWRLRKPDSRRWALNSQVSNLECLRFFLLGASACAHCPPPVAPNRRPTFRL